MKRSMLRAAASLCAAAVLAAGLAACAPEQKTTTTTPAASSAAAVQPAAFEPRLDTQAEVALDAGVFFGNFEALDQVINAFNELYPNVTISYEQVGGQMVSEYLKNNANVDIIMTCDDNIRYPDWTEAYVLDQIADLSTEDIDVSAIQDDMLKACTVDGKLTRIPMGQNLTGIVVNKTLLEKEGLSVPTNYQEFLDTCEALKKAGYTPIQGPEESIYGQLVYNLAMTTLGNDPALLDAVNSGDESAVDALEPIFAKVSELKEKGYIDSAVNAEYPNDNYDGAILKFFEGDVPFWVCNSEKYSGMKKRESKSETFSASPFEYQFLYAPMADDGAPAFVEAWYGFSVNKNSDSYDYAVEFIRFLAQEDQLNTLASVKGVPTVTRDNPDARYDGIRNAENVTHSFTNKGELLNHVKEYFISDARDLGNGTFADARAAAEDYVSRCAETAQSMAENS